MGALEGRTALVTGGSRGIGRAIALAFAQAGADVAISYLGPYDRDRPGGDAFAVERRIESMGRRALAAEADVSREEDVRSLVDRTLDAFGRVDVLVNIRTPFRAPKANAVAERWVVHLLDLRKRHEARVELT